MKLLAIGQGGGSWLGTRLAIFLLLCVVAAGLQWHSGAYADELGSGPDEAAHYVTGLLVRDYVAALAPSSPMEYAERYYLHYPKVAMGHWPPVFYVVEAAWMMVFSVSHLSVMVLMAMCGALLALLAGVVAAGDHGWWAGIGVGVATLLVYWVQVLDRMVTPDVLTAALIVVAALVYARYLEHPSWRSAAAFGLAASLACLTKGTGFVLAFLPGFSVLLTRRFRLLKSFSFWLPAGIVAALCGPWYLLAPSGLHQAAYTQRAVFLSRPVAAATWVMPRLVHFMGGPLDVLAAVGAVIVLVRLARRRDQVRPEWVVMTALVPGYWALCIVVAPARDPKSLIICAASMVLLAAVAIAWLASLGPVRKLPRAVLGAALVLALTGFGVSESSRLPRLEYRGDGELIRALDSLQGGGHPAVLISADSAGEGAFVAQVAMTDKRPGFYVLRGSKVLAHSGWFGENFELRYHSTADLMAFLESVPVTSLVLDSTPALLPGYHDQLLEVVRTYPNRWRLVGRYPKGAGDGPGEGKLALYELVGPRPKITGSFEVNLKSSLGRVLRFEPQ